MNDVFISFSSKDKNIADAVCSILEQYKIKCWLSSRDIEPGSNYGEEIIKAIENSRVIVLVFSNHVNNSRHVANELERALNYNKIIIPFRVEDVLPAKTIEYFLSTSHWIDAMTEPLEDSIVRLAETIFRIFEREGETLKTDECLKESLESKSFKDEKRKKMRWIVASASAIAVIILSLLIGISVKENNQKNETLIPTKTEVIRDVLNKAENEVGSELADGTSESKEDIRTNTDDIERVADDKNADEQSIESEKNVSNQEKSFYSDGYIPMQLNFSAGDFADNYYTNWNKAAPFCVNSEVYSENVLGVKFNEKNYQYASNRFKLPTLTINNNDYDFSRIRLEVAIDDLGKNFNYSKTETAIAFFGYSEILGNQIIPNTTYKIDRNGEFQTIETDITGYEKVKIILLPPRDNSESFSYDSENGEFYNASKINFLNDYLLVKNLAVKTNDEINRLDTESREFTKLDSVFTVGSFSNEYMSEWSKTIQFKVNGEFVNEDMMGITFEEMKYSYNSNTFKLPILKIDNAALNYSELRINVAIDDLGKDFSYPKGETRLIFYGISQILGNGFIPNSDYIIKRKEGFQEVNVNINGYEKVDVLLLPPRDKVEGFTYSWKEKECYDAAGIQFMKDYVLIGDIEVR